jgi:hypothetical protein
MSPVLSSPYSSDDDDDMIKYLGYEFFETVTKKRNFATMNGVNKEVMPIEHLDKKRKLATMKCGHEDDLDLLDDDMMMYGAGADGALENAAAVVFLLCVLSCESCVQFIRVFI